MKGHDQLPQSGINIRKTFFTVRVKKQVAQRDCGVFILGRAENHSGPALSDPALSTDLDWTISRKAS